MAIRFQCGSCSQPIEVDDEWASKVVACPFCRRTTTAPGESTLMDLSRIPVATPLHPGDPPAFASASPTAVGRNRLAVAAMILSFAVVAQLLMSAVIARQHFAELQSVQQRMMESQKDAENPFIAAQRTITEFYEQNGGMPPGWFMALGMLYLTAGLTWLAAMICGAIAVSRPHRRGLAVASLLTAGIAPILFCCSGGTGLS